MNLRKKRLDKNKRKSKAMVRDFGLWTWWVGRITSWGVHIENEVGIIQNGDELREGEYNGYFKEYPIWYRLLSSYFVVIQPLFFSMFFATFLTLQPLDLRIFFLCKYYLKNGYLNK